MNCATENALNKYQEKLKKQELSYDLFLTAIDDDLVEIQELIKKKLRRKLTALMGMILQKKLKKC